MNLVADESIDRQIVERLREDGHDVAYIAEIEPSISDDLVFERSNASASLLLTADKDFGEIVFREGRLSSGGVILLRLAGISPDTKAEIASRCVAENGENLKNQFCVVSPGRVRIRPNLD